MPTANVQIAIGVQRQNALRKLQKQLERLERQARDLTVGFGVTRGLRQLKRVDKELDLIRADAKNIPVSFKVDKRGLKNAQGGGGGGGGVGGGAILGLGAAATVTSQIQADVARISAELRTTGEYADDYAAATKEVAAAQEKLDNNLDRQAANTNELVELEKKRNIQAAQVENNAKRIAAGQNVQKKTIDDANRLLTDTNKKINNINSSQRGLVTFQEKYEKSVGDANRKLDQTNKKVDKLANKTARAGKGFGAIGKVLGALALAQAGKSIIQVGIDAAESERRLAALSRVFGEVQETQLAASRAADRFGISQREASKQFAQIYARLRPVGIELDNIESAFNGFNTAARLAGSSTQEASAAWLQLSQALGSGVLRGEELNSVFEQTPTVVQAIADVMDVPIGKIRDLAKEGKITSDIVLKALKNIETEGVDQLAESMNGPRQKFKDFQNAVEEVSIAIANTILPELAQAFRELGAIILELKDPIREIARFAAEKFRAIVQYIRTIKGLNGDVAAQRASVESDINAGELPIFAFAENVFGKEQFAELRKQAKEYAKYRDQEFKTVLADLAKDRLRAMEGDGYITGAAKKIKKLEFEDEDEGGGSGSTKSLTNAAEYVKETERRLALLQAETPLAKELLQLEFDRKDALLDITENVLPEFQQAAADAVNTLYDAERGNAIGEALAQDLQDAIELKRAEEEALLPLKEQEALLRARLQGKEEEVALEQELERILRETPSLDREKVRAQLEVNKGLEKEVEQMLEMEAMARSIADAFTGALMDGIKGLIDGTKSLNDVLSDMLSKLADVFLNIAMNQLSGGITNLLSPKPAPRALGGPVNAGEPYLVGEEGPELMIPGYSGSVVPNDAFSAAARALSRGGGAGYAGMDATGAQAEAFAASNGALAGQVSNYSTYNNTVNQQAFNTASAARATTTEINRNTSTMNQIREYEERVMNNPSALKVDYQATVINNQTYVTEEQFQKGLTQSTNRARQATIRDLRNNPASRKMAGVNK